jgi:hypothetical protein
MTKNELEQVFNERIAAVFKIASDLVRKKRDSLSYWDAGYSADEETQAEFRVRNTAQDAMRSSLSEIADVCDEVAEQIVRKHE